MESSLLMNVMLTDDGNTLLAVRQGHDGSLELMSTPVTIIQDQSVNTLQLLKSSSCNIVFNQVQINNILPINTQQLSNVISTEVINLESQNYQVISRQSQSQSAKVIYPVRKNPKLHSQEPKAINNSLQTIPASQSQPSKIFAIAEKRIEDTISKNIPDTRLHSNKGIPIISLEEETTEDASENVEENFPKKKQSGKSYGKSKKKSKNDSQLACLKCDICGQEFKKQYLMQKHMHDHAQEKPYHCPKCPASFNVPSNFTLHMATHTFSDPKCPECGKKFARVASLKTHMVIHEVDENLYCTDCDDKFETKAQLEAHLKLHNEKCSTDEHRKCKLCRKQFSQPAVYRQHLRDHYKLQTKFTKQTKWGVRHRTTYKCKICMKMFDKPSQLVRHIRVHTGEKPYKCNLCNRAFTQKGSVRIHMWQHNGVRPYSCNLCNAAFSQKGNLNSHVERVHKAQEGSTMYRCMQCPCFFKKLGSLNGHMKRVHGGTRTEETLDREEETVAPDEEANNEGEEESQQLVNGTLRTNEQLPESLLESETDKTESVIEETPQKFEDGFVVTDNTEQTALVTLLDKSSSDPQGKYIKIKQRFVNNSRFYECSFCDKKFKKPSDLIRHLRIHTQEKPFKCKTCNRSFTLKSTMLTHEKIHKNTKKFPCHLCYASFKFQSELADHEKFHKEQLKTEANKNQQKAGRTKPCQRKKQFGPEVQNKMPEVVLKEPLVLTEAGDGMLHAQPKYRNDIAHGKGRPHKCYVCPAAFMKLSHLKQHHRKHTGERPFACHLCDRSFSTNSALKAHRRTHDLLKPHECSICGITFSTLSSMKRHHITHTNKRPYMCPYCNKTFKSTVNCRKHMKLHKQEIAQQQLELEKKKQQFSNSTVNNIRTITIAEPIIINNQQIFPPITANLQQNLNGQLHATDGDKETSFLSIPQASQNILETNASAVENCNINSTQTLHASETGTITLANYPGDQTLTPENIRQLEETLNQQLFNIGLNVSSNNTNKSIENNINILENQEAHTLSIIYDDGKMLESAINTSINADNVFAQQFDNFDIGQATLQAGAQIMGISNTNTADLTNILQNQLSPTQKYTVQLVDNNVEIDSTFNQNHMNKENQNNESLTSYINQNQNQNNKNSFMNNLQCHTCNLGNFDVSSLKEHIKSHQNRVHECTQCLSKFATNKELSEHVKVHENQETHKCYECHKEFPTTLQLREHIKEHVKHELKLKNLGADDDVIDFESESNNEPVSKRINICQYCSKSFRKPSDLIRHVRTHTGEKPYQCQYCDKSFAVKCTLDSHLKVHAGEKTYYCSVCNTMYATRGSLKVHMRLHTGDRPFTCAICNMTFRTSGHRKVHMISHTREPGSTSRKSKKGKTEGTEQPSDNFVQMVQVPNIYEPQQDTTQNQNLNTITINSLTDQVTLTSDNSILSDGTNLLALNENNQLVQLLLANGLVTIQMDDSMICTQPSVTEKVDENNFVRPHELQKETNQMVYTAELSNVIPPTTNANDYQLNNCMVLQMGNDDSSVMDNSDDVDTLNEAKCLKNIKHKCDVCGKGFAKPCQVERHKRTHTGERPFQCEICNKSFSQKSTLQMHQKYHKGDRPHACPHCERSFTQSGNLLTHLRRVHKLDPAETKRLPKEQQFVFYDPKLLQQNVDDARNLCLDDISLIELLK